MHLTPRPYQLEGRDFLAGKRFALLADEMRVGKTPQAILAAEKIGAWKILVVCPAIAVPHWLREFDRWWASHRRPHLTVVSYDRARIDAVRLTGEAWDLVIVDECHFAKNPEAQRTKLIYGKDGLGWHSDRLWALSGTPATKHAGELWPMLCAFGETKLTYFQFTQHFCRHDWTGKIVGTNEKRIPELKALLAQVMLRRTRREVAPDMPAIDFQFLEVAPVDGVALNIPSSMNDAQLLNWTERDRNADSENRIDVALAKVKPLVDEIVFAIENNLRKQTVVFGWHVEPLRQLAMLLDTAGVSVGVITGATSIREREDTQKGFRGRVIQVICANILTAGTSIDLSAASHAYFLELDWLPGNNVQAAARLVSMEKSEKVTADVVTWPGSTDDRVQKVLLRRSQELSKLY